MKSVYLDNASNTKIDPKILKEMNPYLKNFVGNSSSIHDFGVKANQAIKKARENIADHLGFQPNEIYFTSGATEANNWILKSLALYELFYNTNKKYPRKHILVSAIEHSSVMKACQEIEKWGFDVTYIEPNTNGVIPVSSVKKLIRKDTLFVCVMGVNNELGTYNRIEEIGKIAHHNRSYMISDCTQLVGNYLGNYFTKMSDKYSYVDCFTFSTHKLYGPTGVGCLIARSSVPLLPFLSGGSQEYGKRGGTSNVPGIVATSAAISLLCKYRSCKHYNELYAYLKAGLDDLNQKYNFNIKFNSKEFLGNIVSVNFGKVFNSENLANDFACRNIAVSPGSACDINHNELEGQFNPSHVLKAIKLTDQDIKNTVRVSFAKYTTKKDIQMFLKTIEKMYLEQLEIEARKE